MKKIKIAAATENKNKLREFKEIFNEMGFDAEVFSARELGMGEFPPEDADSFDGNAAIKAKALHNHLQTNGHDDYVVLADDSGITAEALGGAPGVYSARYAGEHGDDEKNNDKLLAELSSVPLEKRTARFVSVVTCVFPDGRKFTVRGECEGKIGFEPKGTNGFGYDPYFISELGVMAELTSEQKDSISHRGKALKLFKQELKKYIKINEE
jgi:XTP/dITP diphosphohydrolase